MGIFQHFPVLFVRSPRWGHAFGQLEEFPSHPSAHPSRWGGDGVGATIDPVFAWGNQGLRNFRNALTWWIYIYIYIHTWILILLDFVMDIYIKWGSSGESLNFWGRKNPWFSTPQVMTESSCLRSTQLRSGELQYLGIGFIIYQNRIIQFWLVVSNIFSP